MSKEDFENPVAVGVVKVQGVIYQSGEAVPAEKVDPDRLARLVAKGLLSYGEDDEPPADGPAGDKTDSGKPDADKTEIPEKPAEQPAKDRAETKTGRPDLKLPEGETGE